MVIPKRVLLVHDDRIQSGLFAEKMQAHGFLVRAARTPDEALKICSKARPDIVLLDLVLPDSDAMAFILKIRTERGLEDLPILALPTSLHKLGQRAIQAGANAFVEESPSVAAVVNAILKMAERDPLDSASAALLRPASTWMDAVLGTGPESVNQMRECLPGMMSGAVDSGRLHALWALVHGFAGRMAFTDFHASTQIASAFDSLMMELNENPDQVNASCARTVGQALDILMMLCTKINHQHLRSVEKAKVIVVDDEENAREFITEALRAVKLECLAVGTPGEALKILESDEADLILLDVGLPEMSGFDVCAKVRALDRHKKTPIIFLTGMNTFQNKAKASLSGGNDFVGKPFNLPELGLKALVWYYRGQLGKV